MSTLPDGRETAAQGRQAVRHASEDLSASKVVDATRPLSAPATVLFSQPPSHSVSKDRRTELFLPEGNGGGQTRSKSPATADRKNKAMATTASILIQGDAGSQQPGRRSVIVMRSSESAASCADTPAASEHDGRQLMGPAVGRSLPVSPAGSGLALDGPARSPANWADQRSPAGPGRAAATGADKQSHSSATWANQHSPGGTGREPGSWVDHQAGGGLRKYPRTIPPISPSGKASSTLYSMYIVHCTLYTAG
jgi:hypothetical protein